MKILVPLFLLCALFPPPSARADKPATKPEPQGILQRGNTWFTGFENLNGNGTDRTNFRVGPALFTGGAAGTRQFPPGYFRGMFAFITAGQTGITSVITFDRGPNNVHFRGKDIRELTPAGRGFLIVQYQGGGGERIALTPRWRPYHFRNVASITVRSSGVSNLDTFWVQR